MATIFIATTILFLSLSGIGWLCYSKIPILINVSKKRGGKKSKSLFLILEKRIKGHKFFKNFSYEMFLQKILSKIRILTLKTDSKTSSLLQELRQKSQEKKDLECDDYWEEIQKSQEED